MSDKFRKLDLSSFRLKARFERPLAGRHLSSPIYQRCGMQRPSVDRQRLKWRQMQMGIMVRQDTYRNSVARLESLAIGRRLASKTGMANRVFQFTFGFILSLLLFCSYDGLSNTRTNATFTATLAIVQSVLPKPVIIKADPPIIQNKTPLTEIPVSSAPSVSMSQVLQPAQAGDGTFDLDFKVRELTKGTGNNISNVRVDIDNGSYIGFTDANGVAHIPQIPSGNHTINMSKEGYLEFTQANYTLDGNKTFNASIPKKTQVGPWGTTTLEAKKYFDVRSVNQGLNEDPPHWAQIIPINNRISGAGAADSTLVLEAITALESKTGYDLINLGNYPEESSYTINMNASTDASNVWGENGMIIAGESYITRTDQMKRVIHEILKQVYMWPHRGPPFTYNSVMAQEPYLVDPTPNDYLNVALNISQPFAVKRGEQNFFMGNMEEYSVLIAPVKTAITSPANNSTGLDKLVRLTWNNVIDANKYNVDIATDANFTNIVKDFNAQRIDTTLTLNEDTKYYMRVRAENTTGNATWSDVITFTTKPKTNHAPTQPVPTSPISSETKDATTPITFTWTNSTDSDNDPITYKIHILNPKDTTINNVVSGYILPANKLNGHTTYTYNIIASDGKIETTSANAVLNTINHAPASFEFTKPTNNERIEYTNHNLEIITTTPTDKDNDPLTKTIRLTGDGLDTLIYADATIQTIYLESNKLKLNTEYTLTGEVTDGIATTQATNSITFKTPTGVGLTDLLATGAVAVFPNPSQGKVSVKTNFDTPQNMQITVYDQVGLQVAGVSVKVVLKTTIPVDLSASAPGIYTFRITTQKGTVWHKVVIAR